MSDSLNNLFIVRSPLQIINAIEAIDYFKLQNNTLVLIYGGSDINRNQMEQIIGGIAWKKIIRIENRLKSKYFQYVNLIKELKKNNYHYLFIGEIGSLHRVLIPNVIKKKVFLLDDGTVTLKYYNNIIKKDKYNKYNFKELRFLFSAFKIKIKDKINLFTYFDLKPIHGIDVIKNNLNYFKNSYLKDAKKDENTIYFIGLPIEASNLITKDNYKNILLNLIKKFNKKMIYIPHRGESESFISELLSIENPLFNLKRINQPVELFFLKNKIYPLHVVSYFSTALTTLGVIFEDCKINNIKIHENIDNKHYFDFNNLRDYYKTIDEKQIITYKDLGILE